MDLDAAGNRLDTHGVKLLLGTGGDGQECRRPRDAFLGGYGYMGEYVVERLWRDGMLLEIGGGTLEVASGT